MSLKIKNEDLESIYSHSENLRIVESLEGRLQDNVAQAIYILRLCRLQLFKKGLLHSHFFVHEISKTLVHTGLSLEVSRHIELSLQPYLGHRESIDGKFLENLELALIGSALMHEKGIEGDS